MPRWNSTNMVSHLTITVPPDITVEERELLRFIKWKMVRDLPTDRQKLIFIMKHILEMSQQDIAFCLDVHKTEIVRQKIKIRQNLDHYQKSYK